MGPFSERKFVVIGVAAIVPHSAQADSLIDEIVNFVEQNTEADEEADKTGVTYQLSSASINVPIIT